MRFHLVLLAATLLGAACASVQQPKGGPRDEQGPRLSAAEPPNGTRNFRGKAVTFHFDEFLQPGLGNNTVFISPYMPSAAYEVTTLNKRLRVEFLEPLDSNTTYVLSLGKEVVDFHEGNPLSEPIQYAISTGPQLDSCQVRGQMRDAFSHQPAADYSVLLFPADSVRGRDFRMRTPAYVSLLDDDGSFRLDYLRPGRYRLFGLNDADNNFQYNLPNEGVGIPQETSLVVLDSATCQSIIRNLLTFRPDSIRPGVLNTRWRTPSVLGVIFSEDVLGVQARWPTTGEALPAVKPPPGQSDKPLRWIPLPTPLPTDSFRLQLTAFQDTAGNTADTTLVLHRPSEDQQFERKLSLFNVATPRQPRNLRFLLPAPLAPGQQLDSLIRLRDSSRAILPVSAAARGLFLDITLPAALDSAQTYRLQIDTALRTVDGYRPDSQLTRDVTPATPSRQSSLVGRIAQDSVAIERPLLLLSGPPEEPLKASGFRFRLEHLPPGKYRYRLIGDRDANGRWTTGNLFPWRPPEPVYDFPEPVPLRPGWVVEDFVIDPATARPVFPTAAPAEADSAATPTPPATQPGK